MVLGIGGSRGMSGAIAMTGRAALAAGAGLVRLAIPDPVLETVASYAPELMCLPLEADRKGRIALDALPRILRHLDRVSTVAIGPGLSQSLGLHALVARLYAQLPMPMVIDADAINALSVRGIPEKPGGMRILTPHPGEFARLAPGPVESQEKRAVDFAAAHGVLLVLKGHRTLITDGRKAVHNVTGNPGMATGGSGDVLTGVLAGVLAQCPGQCLGQCPGQRQRPELSSGQHPGIGLDPFEAVRIGVHWHGLAGDLAAKQLGEESLTAGALIDFLPAAAFAMRATMRAAGTERMEARDEA